MKKALNALIFQGKGSINTDADAKNY